MCTHIMPPHGCNVWLIHEWSMLGYSVSYCVRSSSPLSYRTERCHLSIYFVLFFFSGSEHRLLGQTDQVGVLVWPFD